MAKKRQSEVDAVRADARLRARIGWTRLEWINEAESIILRALFRFCEARHFRKVGMRRAERDVMADVERGLVLGVVHLFVHPVRRNFDRAAAFERALQETRGPTYAAIRRHVDRTFPKQAGQPRRRITDRDIKAFEALVAGHADVLAEVEAP